MPPFSDPPHPFSCLLNGFATTFERYQVLSEASLSRPCRDQNGQSGEKRGFETASGSEGRQQETTQADNSKEKPCKTPRMTGTRFTSVLVRAAVVLIWKALRLEPRNSHLAQRCDIHPFQNKKISVFAT